MICVEERDLWVEFNDLHGDCSWSVIAEAIRGQAESKPAEAAADLKRWADLLEGLGELTERAG